MSFVPFQPKALLHFAPVKSLLTPEVGLSHEERQEKLMAEILWPTPSFEGLGEWPLVERLMQRDGIFVIQASDRISTAELRFDPSLPDRGDYQIRYRGRQAPETGRVVWTKILQEMATLKELAVLNSFKFRYLVRTVSSSRPISERLWRVAFDEFNIVSEKD